MGAHSGGEGCSCCDAPRHGLNESLEEIDFYRSLQGAAHAGDSTKLRVLLQRGANVDGLEGDAYSPLHYAARNGHVDACRLLLQNNATVDRRTRAGQATSLHRAAHEGHEKVVELLLQGGANPLCQDADGCTPVHKAAMQGRVGTVKLLVTACPEALAIRDKHGRLAKDCAQGPLGEYFGDGS